MSLTHSQTLSFDTPPEHVHFQEIVSRMFVYLSIGFHTLRAGLSVPVTILVRYIIDVYIFSMVDLHYVELQFLSYGIVLAFHQFGDSQVTHSQR